MKYNFTNHLRERFQERFPYKIQDNNVNKAIAIEFYQKSSPNRSIFNNTALMAEMYRKYGYDRKMEFFTSPDVVFVCIDDTIVTVYDRMTSVFAQNLSRFQK